jgi:drug/metabolite transporter (DMT)-like permease
VAGAAVDRLSALAEGAYALGLAAAYRRGALSVVYPAAPGTAPILVTLGAWFVLGQRPGPIVLLGAGALAAGLIVVGLSGRRAGQSAAVGFALLTGLAIATYQVIDARAVQEVSPLGYLEPVLLGQGLLLAAYLRGDRTRLRRALAPGARIAVGTVVAYLLVLAAFQQANAGSVATLREVSVVVGVALARERAGRPLWVGASLVVTGMVLVAV